MNNINGSQKLDEVRRGEARKLVGLGEDHGLAQRLMAMGFLPGQVVERREQAPFNGPLKVHGGGAVVGLRVEDAACLRVE